MLNHKGFDLWADGYDKSVGLSDEANTYPFAGYKKVLAAIFQTVMQTPNASVLDIGFGTAVLTAKLYEQGCTIYGQDFSSRMIELASEKMPDAQLYQGDFTTGLVEPLRDRRYDYIVATYSLHHLTDAQKVVFLSALRGCLNENGKILIGDVAFETRGALNRCRQKAGADWDVDEIYFVAGRIKKGFSRPFIYAAIPLRRCSDDQQVILFWQNRKTPPYAAAYGGAFFTVWISSERAFWPNGRVGACAYGGFSA